MDAQDSLFPEFDNIRDLTTKKLCDQCHECYPLSNFDRDPYTHDLFDHRCKECKSDEARLRKYGLSSEEHSLMLREQEGNCAICLDRPAKKLLIDHDHKSGKVRGLLCGNCNTGLGMFKDSPLKLLTAIEYLKKSMEREHGTTNSI